MNLIKLIQLMNARKIKNIVEIPSNWIKNSRFIWMNGTPEVGHAPENEDEPMDKAKSTIELLGLLQQFEDALEKYGGESIGEKELIELNAIADTLGIPHINN